MSNLRSRRTFVAFLIARLSLVCLLTAQEKKVYRYTVRSRAVISITNNYGPVTVSSSENDDVKVTTLAHSDGVSLEGQQHGNRVELRASSTREGTNLIDCMVNVPSAAFVTVRSSEATIHAQELRGDIILEAMGGSVEASNMSQAHLHVKTLSGRVALSEVHDSRVDVNSVTGNVDLHNVTGSFVEVHSGSGRVRYDGDPGSLSEYVLTTHSGDLEVSIPMSSLVEIKAHSLKGQADTGLASVDSVPPAGERNLLVKPGIASTSRFVLRSFRGAIHVKRP